MSRKNNTDRNGSSFSEQIGNLFNPDNQAICLVCCPY